MEIWATVSENRRIWLSNFQINILNQFYCLLFLWNYLQICNDCFKLISSVSAYWKKKTLKLFFSMYERSLFTIFYLFTNKNQTVLEMWRFYDVQICLLLLCGWNLTVYWFNLWVEFHWNESHEMSEVLYLDKKSN